ncbi:MAG: hypothetical protein JNK53_02790 [Phycisphaerae bacterium]|nr:hypothetical protein [Phycisphaerae bacterium]
MAAEASLAMDLNTDGVVVGAYAHPDAFGAWNWTAAVWRPTSSGLVRSNLAAPPLGCAPLDSIALGVGPGVAPAVVGAAHTRCVSLLEEPFVAMLDADPAMGGTMTPLLGPSFECDFDQPVTSGMARAVVTPSTGSHLAIGHRYQFMGLQGCTTPLAPCDSTAIVEHNAHGWWLGGAPFPELYIARLPGYRFSASDGQAQDPAEELEGWSVAGGWLRDTSGPARYDRAAVFMGYIAGTPWHQPSVGNSQGSAFPLHDAIVPSLPSDVSEMQSSKVAHAIRAPAGLSPIEWLACGARYGERDYGILWMGRDDGDGGIEWCGRNVNDPDVAWRPDDALQVTALLDVESHGVGVGTATGQLGGTRLVVLTDIADLSGDFVVGGADLGILLTMWGSTSTGSPWWSADLDRDGTVSGSDLGALLTRWTDGELVAPSVPCTSWQSISPLDITEALLLLGLEDAQRMGDICSQLPLDTAVGIAEYVITVAHIMNQGQNP